MSLPPPPPSSSSLYLNNDDHQEEPSKMKLFGFSLNPHINHHHNMTTTSIISTNNTNPNPNSTSTMLVKNKHNTIENEIKSLQSSSSSRFKCNYCDLAFPNGHAFGGHQNAHKIERRLRLINHYHESMRSKSSKQRLRGSQSTEAFVGSTTNRRGYDYGINVDQSRVNNNHYERVNNEHEGLDLDLDLELRLAPLNPSE